jgi:SAM-dependent methyltransferase
MRVRGTTTEHDGTDLELFFLTEVLGLTSLHYGYWDAPPPDDALTLASLAEAQARFTERLLALVPPGTRSALDVGSGIGDNAAAMRRRGLEVTALSPDRNHRRFYEPLAREGVVFRNERFEDLDEGRRFDLVLMSESQNYFSADDGLRQATRHLEPDGHLLVGGFFRREDSEAFDHVTCIEKPYLARAAAHGFALERHLDVTENVLPTLRLAERYVKPCLDLAQRYFESAPPWKRWLTSLLVGKRRMNPTRLRRYYEDRVAPDRFREHVKYAFLLFSRAPAPAHENGNGNGRHGNGASPAGRASGRRSARGERVG